MVLIGLRRLKGERFAILYCRALRIWTILLNQSFPDKSAEA
jgi:hypothetical protein